MTLRLVVPLLAFAIAAACRPGPMITPSPSEVSIRSIYFGEEFPLVLPPVQLPPEFRLNARSGFVFLRFELNKAGEVERSWVVVSNLPDALQDLSREAVDSWIFQAPHQIRIGDDAGCALIILERPNEMVDFELLETYAGGRFNCGHRDLEEPHRGGDHVLPPFHEPR